MLHRKCSQKYLEKGKPGSFLSTSLKFSMAKGMISSVLRLDGQR